MTSAVMTPERIDEFSDEFVDSTCRKFLEVFGTPEAALEAVEAIGICGTHGGDCPKVMLYRKYTLLSKEHEKAAP